MAYKPKIVTGKVKGTDYPIDGRVLYFTLWDYDRENWHLYGWDDENDEAVMLTMYQCEREDRFVDSVENGAEYIPDTLESFTEKWKAKEWTPLGPFCLPLDKVEVQEVKQEEEKDDAREKLLAHGIDLSPRKDTDRGGILCLPLDENLNGDTKKKHPEWEPMACPLCGRKCWKPAGVDKLQKEQGVQLLCTQCALDAGLVQPYRPNNTPKPGGNRAQRRRAKHERKKK